MTQPYRFKYVPQRDKGSTLTPGPLQTYYNSKDVAKHEYVSKETVAYPCV